MILFCLVQQRSFYKAVLVRPIERFLRRASTSLNYIFNKKDIEAIFIIASARSGSYLLQGFLASHPEIDAVGEVINPDIVRGIRRQMVSRAELFFHIKASINKGKKRMVVAKLLEEQFAMHDLIVADLMHEFPKAKFVTLYRASLLDQYISKKIAELTNVWKLGDKPAAEYKPQGFELDLQDFDAFKQRMQDFYQQLPEIENQEQLVSLTYEDLTTNAQTIFETKVFPFLGLAPVTIETEFKKMNKKTHEQTITNYSEVKDRLESKDYCLAV